MGLYLASLEIMPSWVKVRQAWMLKCPICSDTEVTCQRSPSHPITHMKCWTVHERPLSDRPSMKHPTTNSHHNPSPHIYTNFDFLLGDQPPWAMIDAAPCHRQVAIKLQPTWYQPKDKLRALFSLKWLHACSTIAFRDLLKCRVSNNSSTDVRDVNCE